MTRLRGPALRLTVIVGEHELWHHKPLYAEIVHRAHAAGLAGASVFRGIEGFGGSSVVHTQRLLSLSEDLPVAVVVVDTEVRVRDFLPQLAELVAEAGLVTLDRCAVLAPGDLNAAGDGGTEGEGGTDDGTDNATDDGTDGGATAAGGRG
ncbi:DUF190 domain-containing protein [Streptomyces sp. NPDC048638]|uniref:DUF190 domain-containing protein n=1 Tax=Streptomyces sp. NPDC048638 TaxID=3365580 RepID=UPI00371B7192